MRDRLLKLIADHEGFRSTVYRCPAGYNTVGFGRNLDAKGVTVAEGLHLLNNDIAECEADMGTFPWFSSLSEPRKAALIDMRFNLGAAGLRRFKAMLAAFEDGNYAEASRQALDSRWAKQVGRRAATIARMIERGEW